MTLREDVKHIIHDLRCIVGMDILQLVLLILPKPEKLSFAKLLSDLLTETPFFQ